MIFESVIYEEELDSYTAEVEMERALNNSIFSIDMIHFESTSSDADKESKFKATINRVIEAFKILINKCRDYLDQAIKKVTGRIDDACTEFKLNNILNSFNNSISKAEENGMKTFKFIAMNELTHCMQDECNAYKKIIKDFSKKYINRAAPKDAEKVVKKFDEISKSYDDKLKKILDESKEYSIREAKLVRFAIEHSRKGGFLGLVEEHRKTCDDVENLTVGLLNSLNKYSEDTGYIQNAKKLQEMIHNSCIRIQVHSSECIIAVLKYGIPFVTLVDKIAHTKTTLDYDEDDKPHINTKDRSSDERKQIRDTISNASKTAGKITNASLRAMRTISRKTDIKNWKDGDEQAPLAFDNRNLSKDEYKKVPVKAALNLITEL